MVKAYLPKVEVTLIKVVQRDRNRPKPATGPDSIIDLTPYLAEGSVVTFSRGINQPAGVFSIDFPDQMMPQSRDTLYSMVEPMDIIEIRMAREPHKYPSGLPVVFRGFVSLIKRNEKMSGGKPQRRVVISGRDWGGIMQSIQIFYKKDYAVGQIIMDSFPMFSTYGVTLEYLSPSDFVSVIVDKIVTPWLDALWKAAKVERRLRLEPKTTVTQGRVGTNGIQHYEGGIWGLLSSWTDLAWNELIFDDDDGGSYLRYRAKPYRDIETGELVMSDAVEPDRVEMGADAVVSLNVERNIERVFNYFHVEAPQAVMNSVDLINVEAMQKGSVFVTDDPNTDPVIYGLRKLTEATTMTSPDNTNSVADKPSDEQQSFIDQHNDWLGSRRDDLKGMRKDASVLESGSMTLRGNERIKPGVYIDIDRGAVKAEYYAQNVTHTFEVLGAYITEVEFIRGTGFIKRMETPNYLNETSRGVYGKS
ncbi:MAG TPA: hypothetical protein ENJ35_10975 [Gammaproteobacteria bacterium]|nr:hypothetical protein [Gammaproteobacteria bacterium]